MLAERQPLGCREKMVRLKIGKTIVPVTRRLRDVQVNHQRPNTIEVYRSGRLTKRNTDRLEKLVLSDLAEYQAKYVCYCQPGGRVHREWFRTTSRKAIRSMKLWRRYLVEHKAFDKAGNVSVDWQTSLWNAVEDFKSQKEDKRRERYVKLRTRIGHGFTRPITPLN